MYNYFTGILCFLPMCANILCTLLYKKFTEVRSPTYYYKNTISDLNTVFYKPLLQDEDDEINETNKNINNKNINDKNINNKNINDKNINDKNINNDNNNNFSNKDSIKLDISEPSFYYNEEELNKQHIDI